MVATNRRLMSGLQIVAQQRLGVTGDRGERGLELVRHVGHEVAPHRLEPPELGEIVQHQHGPARRQRPRVHQQRAVFHLDFAVLHQFPLHHLVDDLPRALHPKQLRRSREAIHRTCIPESGGPPSWR